MSKILNAFRWKRRRMESDLERELQYHLDRRVEDLIKTGLDETEARRLAMIEFGGLSQTQEETRETWVWRWLDSLLGDIRYSIRSLSKSLTFTLGAGAVLALAIGAFAAIAMLLSAVGVFSLLAYLVGQRTKELAIRRALGAKTVDVVRLVVGQGLRLVAVGLAVGLAGAIAVARLLEKLLFGISPWDFNAYLGAIAALGIAAALAILLPSIRAAAVDPLIALRHD